MSSRKQASIDASKGIFVISDLHLGDRSAKDRFVIAGKETLLNGFLDHVQREEGRLIIGGDLFELWRYTLDQVTHQWQDLLQRFQKMGAPVHSGKPRCHCGRFAGGSTTSLL